MRIGELSRSTGVDIETIRYYERVGLLLHAKREPNGYRRYSERHLERLAFIRHCRALDMSVADVRLLLDFLAQPGRNCRDVDQVVDAQLGKVRARLKSLRALEKQLSALRAQCRTPSSRRKCGIVHELITAARAEAVASLPCRASQSSDSKGISSADSGRTIRSVQLGRRTTREEPIDCLRGAR